MNEWLALLQASVAQRRIRMEVVYLLCSAISTFLTSSLLSLALAIRSIPLCFSCLRFHCDRNAAVLLYEGRVRHARRRPVKHAFEYSVRYALIDLDGAPHPSHLSAERAREIARTNGPVFLLTIPESVGYEQNPLSVYYCYDVEEGKGEEGDGPKPSLKMCIAEVTNTPWGERVSFTFSPGSDVAAKPLHVSPFMDMQGNWHMFADAPGEDLSLVISVQHPTLGNYFTASLHAKRVQSSSSSIFLEKFFWLMPHKVAVWIYWQIILSMQAQDTRMTLQDVIGNSTLEIVDKVMWDEMSSESKVEAFSGVALIASHQDECEENSSEMSINKGGATSEESNSLRGAMDNEIDKEFRNTGSRAKDMASEKNNTGREPSGLVHPRDGRAAEEYTGG
ncbi:hypothetical protein ZIOFF_004189 [Zingiber officinale]|uniref:Uncharacterized protein n=1 Tax=Zingiber officinale TaxID=94328 RepID=A0A8J5I1H9_ZINOF|nr:hypothetical protein ZIOFF_004189 [Zingiber officinale]